MPANEDGIIRRDSYISALFAPYSPWDCPEVHGVAGVSENSPVLLPGTCRKRSCPVCGEYWKQKNYERFAHHIDHYDGQLYSDIVDDPDDWRAIVAGMRRRAKRLGVPLRYVAIRDIDDRLVIIASVHIWDDVTRPIEKIEAFRLLKDVLVNVSLGPRPVLSSRE